MKDIFVGILIILVIFLVGDFIYSEKNTCTSSEVGHIGEQAKCGFLKKNSDINIYLFDRYW